MQEEPLYPMKFQPIYKTKIWGGDKLKNTLNKKEAPDMAGESWEISAVKENVSILNNGFLRGNSLQELVEIYMGDIVGPKVYEKYGNEFPLLVKFIDANDNLSVQVHPDDETAQKRHNAYGKTEMWYILQAEPGAQLVSGFKRPVSKEEFIARMNDGNIQEILNFVDVQAGDVYFIPAGRIHATGAGILFAEIQQTSDITYRVYDWDRVDSNGKSRELHIELARDVIDYSPVKKARTDYTENPDFPARIVSCPYFTSNFLHLTKPLTKSYANCESFVIILCMEGKGKLTWDKGSLTIMKGETVLIPHELMEIMFIPEPETKILETFIEFDE
ncbi:MAG: type I phosphomannose isomerase catalytic subunit [Bacteroidota bacterium]|nr:type I phosphomannose isomerase catalytic subunit [Bacteroidota bacterium]